MGGVRLTDPLDRLHGETDKLYIHMDMDVLDPREVMGHGSKVANGPSSEELAALFEELFRSREPDDRGSRARRSGTGTCRRSAVTDVTTGLDLEEVS